MNKPDTEMRLMAQFLKDCSFESPNSPELFFRKEGVKANVSVNMDIQVKGTENNLYMVDLIVKIHNQAEEDKKTIFMIEMTYSGLAAVTASDEKELQHKLLVDIPTSLYPSVRSLVMHMTGESGYPPFVMGMVDFEQLYQSNQNKPAN